MKRQRIVIVGSNFAGFTAATELKARLKSDHDVIVIAKSELFLFMPSLIGVPFGLATPRAITFPVRAPLAERGIAFRQDELTRLDLDGRRVITRTGEERYDYLVIATGPKPNYAAIPGLGPRGYTLSIMSLADAEQARLAFERFASAPGPVVIGSVQGASSPGAACEFHLAMASELSRRGLADRAPLTHLTAEPHLGRFEAPFEQLGVRTLTNAAVRAVTPGNILLVGGQTLPFAYALLLPSCLGIDAVRACETITNASGFVRVNGFQQTERYPEVFAAGAAVARAMGSVPRSGQLAEETAGLAAHNIAAQIHREPMLSLPPGSADAGSDLEADSHWARLAAQKYFPNLPASA